MRHQLAACAALYPALPQPLLTLLTALSASAYSARSAASFLAGLQGISSFHPAVVRAAVPLGVCMRHRDRHRNYSKGCLQQMATLRGL